MAKAKKIHLDKEIRGQGFFVLFFIIEDIICALIFDHREPQCYFNITLFKKCNNISKFQHNVRSRAI